MNHGTPRTRTGPYVCLFLFGICLAVCVAGLEQEAGAGGRRQEQKSEVRSQRSEVREQTSEVPVSPRLPVSVSALPLLLPPAPASSKIALRVLEDTAGGKSASVVIFLADQADVSAAYEMKDQDARGWYVYHTLSKHAARTQASLKSSLEARGIAYQSFWAANMIVATTDRATVESLAARADVARVDSNRPSRWIEDPKIANVSDATNKPNAIETIETGVNNVNAPSVWAMGFTGQGIVVGGLDTGIRWTHNALKPKYRGWNGAVADHNYNWHDSIHSGGGSCGANTVVPCDDNFHGSHTVGSVVGDDGGTNQIGVAPGARFIGCRNMDQGNGTPATYTECFQWTIAPTDLAGNNPDVTKRPHVLNNSWGCPASEGCVTGAELETIVNNTQAAGIFVVVSAGNSGSGCSSVSDAPAIYRSSFSVGAISGTTNALASFSSRGPSLFYNPNLLKPNISAPGVSVRSVTNSSDTGYSTASGTSMAGPHVAGVVALLWSARPALVRNIAATKAFLQNTANPAVTVAAQTCGGTPSTQIPNNSFGYGRVDALAAVNSGPAIFGRVNYQDGVTPAKNVTVTLTGNNGFATRQTTTDTNGDYVFTGLPTLNNYTVTPTKTGDVNHIESLDASNAARYVAGLDVPTANQQIAADADGDGLVTSFDPALIARYVAGLPGFGIVGTWKFAAPTRTVTALSADQANQDFKAILVGDTGGNWLPAP
jgi:serine protease AprX